MARLEAELKTTRERMAATQESVKPAMARIEALTNEVKDLKAKLAQGGDVARAAVAEITGGAIMLDLDDSGRFFWAIFEDGIRGALLADAELLGVAYSDPSVFGKVDALPD